jgi:hypothetical protein
MTRHGTARPSLTAGRWAKICKQATQSQIASDSSPGRHASANWRNILLQPPPFRTLSTRQGAHQRASTESLLMLPKGAHIIYRSVKFGTQGRVGSTKRLSHGLSVITAQRSSRRQRGIGKVYPLAGLRCPSGGGLDRGLGHAHLHSCSAGLQWGFIWASTSGHNPERRRTEFSAQIHLNARTLRRFLRHSGTPRNADRFATTITLNQRVHGSSPCAPTI